MIIIWRIIPGGWLTTITANHSNYLVCDRANTQSVTAVESGKLQLNYCNALVNLSEFTISSCSEWRTRDVHSSSLLIDKGFFSDVSLRRQASMTKEKFRTLFCSRAMLICSTIWLGCRMLYVVLWVLFFVDTRLRSRICVSLICIVWKLFLR